VAEVIDARRMMEAGAIALPMAKHTRRPARRASPAALVPIQFANRRAPSDANLESKDTSNLMI
jgi:hypothetical protein